MDANYVDRKKFEDKNMVFAHWVAACHVREEIVDQRMFRLSKQGSDEDTKRHHALLYSEEDKTLLDFAASHKDEELTQEQLWELAEEEGILERNALSMLQRYRILKQKKDKKFKHYAEYEVNNILAWAYCWNCLTPKDPR